MNQDFYTTLNRLKFLQRQGWKDRGLNADTIASHTYSAIVIGWVLAHQAGVKVDKVIEMLTVHDLVMAKMEDVTPNSGKYDQKRNLEEEAKSKIAKLLPKNIQKKYLDLFDEFNAQETPEAKIAKQADKLETLLQGEAYEIETSDTTILDEFLETYKNAFTTKLGKQIFQQIKNRHLERSGL